jgi:hypothetical protein
MTDTLERTRWPDDVLRLKDEMDLHAAAGSRGWAVIAMADGAPLDHTAYPAWASAVAAAGFDRDRYLFVEIQPDGMPYREASAVLKYFRTMHDMGYRIPSPDWEAGPLASSMPYRRHDRARMARQLVSGRPLDPDGHENIRSETGLVIPPAFRKAR